MKLYSYFVHLKRKINSHFHFLFSYFFFYRFYSYFLFSSTLFSFFIFQIIVSFWCNFNSIFSCNEQLKKWCCNPFPHHFVKVFGCVTRATLDKYFKLSNFPNLKIYLLNYIANLATSRREQENNIYQIIMDPRRGDGGCIKLQKQ